LPPAGNSNESGPEADDPATFCAEIRGLAYSSWRALARLESGDGQESLLEIEALISRSAGLMRQIDRLERLRGLRLGELGRWAANLRRQLMGAFARLNRPAE
jgi:hypothetical protein